MSDQHEHSAAATHAEPPSESEQPGVEQPEVVRPDVVTGDGGDTPAPSDSGDIEARESVSEPAKVMRIGSMMKLLLEEVRSVSLDESSRERLAEVYERSVTELSEAMSPDLQEELRGLALPFDHDDVPSEAEIRVAKAQLVGWLEGLFHGIQASMMAQQLAARQQLEGMRQLPGGPAGPRPPGMPGDAEGGPDRPGTYL